jgi:hypothetical protein
MSKPNTPLRNRFYYAALTILLIVGAVALALKLYSIWE